MEWLNFVMEPLRQSPTLTTTSSCSFRQRQRRNSWDTYKTKDEYITKDNDKTETTTGATDENKQKKKTMETPWKIFNLQYEFYKVLVSCRDKCHVYINLVSGMTKEHTTCLIAFTTPGNGSSPWQVAGTNAQWYHRRQMSNHRRQVDTRREGLLDHSRCVGGFCLDPSRWEGVGGFSGARKSVVNQKIAPPRKLASLFHTTHKLWIKGTSYQIIVGFRKKKIIHKASLLSQKPRKWCEWWWFAIVWNFPTLQMSGRTNMI